MTTEPKIGDTIQLFPRSVFARTRIQRDGDIFMVKDIKASVPCMKFGRAMLVEPPNGNARWIALPYDLVFDWLKVNNNE